MSDLTNSSLDRESLGRFARHARAGLLMTIVGAAIVVASLVYSTRQLARVQSESAALDAKLADATTQLEKASQERLAATSELERIQTNVKNARSSFIYVQMGLREFFVRDYAQAIELYDRAIAVDSANPVLYDLKGYALLRQKKPQEAVVALEKSIELDPNYVWGHYNLALAYAATGDLGRGVLHIKKVLNIDPNMKETVRRDGQFKVFRDNAEYRALVGEA